MPTLPVTPPGGAEPADPSPRKLAEAVCRNVMAALGRPAGFLRVTARQVTWNSFRVNVVAGPDAPSARITDSFFVTAGDGEILASSPAIRRAYPR